MGVGWGRAESQAGRAHSRKLSTLFVPATVLSIAEKDRVTPKSH